MLQLHRLYREECKQETDTSRTICEVIRFSLGDPRGYGITESRDTFMSMVFEEGIRTPETKTIGSVEEVRAWVAQFGLPAVLKADGTSGGEGVRIVKTLAEAERAFRLLHAPLSTALVVKQALLDQDWNQVVPWLWQQKRAVSIQSFIQGPDANLAVAAWQGRMLAATTVEVLETWRPKGPATLVRLMEHVEMQETIEKILRRLNFSGLCGFDFMLDPSSGHAFLIEMNARATQTCLLPLGAGRDPIAALCSAASGEEVSRPPLDLLSDKIALFPLAWQGDTTSSVFQSAYHDIPWEAPDLVRLGMHMIRPRMRDKWISRFRRMGLHG